VQELRRLDQFIERTFGPKETTEAKAHREELLTRRRQKGDELAVLTRELEKQYGPVAGLVYDRAAVQLALREDAALLGWVDIASQPRGADDISEHWAVVLRARGRPVWQRLGGSGKGGAWTQADSRLPADLRRAILDPTHDWHPLADRLRAQRIDPLVEHLSARDRLPAVRRLIVLPSAALSGVPLEVCAADYQVSYASSGTILAYLRGLPPARGRGVLALADPVFDPEGGKRGRPKPPGGLLATTVVPNGIAARAGSDGGWPELPGTRVEAEGLGRLCGAAKLPFRLLADSDASEQELDRLAGSKELASYRYIHLATHGDLDDRLPLQSAVILARDRLPDPLKQLEAGKPVYTGRLTAETVLERWDLHADLVTLSACETALGKYEGGEGFVGFTQALLLSGARSVCLSLWKVDDTATALLMQRFYANLLGERPGLKSPLGKAEALAEAKRWLRDLTAKEASRQAAALTHGVARGKGRKPLPLLPAKKVHETREAAKPYAHPYYWAAFVLVGDGD
jgi:CHAT domain-containing protein